MLMLIDIIGGEIEHGFSCGADGIFCILDFSPESNTGMRCVMLVSG